MRAEEAGRVEPVLEEVNAVILSPFAQEAETIANGHVTSLAERGVRALTIAKANPNPNPNPSALVRCT